MSTPKATGGVQLTPMVARVAMATAAVQAHTTACELPCKRPACGFTVEHSPSGKPKSKAKGYRLGVSAQLIGEGGDNGEGGDHGGGKGGGESGAGGNAHGGNGGDGGDGGRTGGENGSQQPAQSHPRTSSSLHLSRPFRAPHVVARHPMSQLGVSGGLRGGCGGEGGEGGEGGKGGEGGGG